MKVRATIFACFCGLWGKTLHGVEQPAGDDCRTLCGREVDLRLTREFDPTAARTCIKCADVILSRQESDDGR